jgi:hypothetical protein
LLQYYFGEEEAADDIWEDGHLGKSTIKSTILQKFINLNQKEIADDGKLGLWRMIGPRFDLTFAKMVTVSEHRRDLLRLLSSTHALEVETGRRNRIAAAEPKCNCGMGEVGDELHFLFRCQANGTRREALKRKLTNIGREWDLDSLIWIMNEPMFTSAKEYGHRKRGIEAVATFVSKSFKDKTKQSKKIRQ